MYGYYTRVIYIQIYIRFFYIMVEKVLSGDFVPFWVTHLPSLEMLLKGTKYSRHDQKDPNGQVIHWVGVIIRVRLLHTCDIYTNIYTIFLYNGRKSAIWGFRTLLGYPPIFVGNAFERQKILSVWPERPKWPGNTLSRGNNTCTAITHGWYIYKYIYDFSI